MNLKTKKTIAKEGLLFLSIIVISILFIFIGEKMGEYEPKKAKFDLSTARPVVLNDEGVNITGGFDLKNSVPVSELEKQAQMQNVGTAVANIGIFSLFFGYPIYLLIRFLIWAIKTLKGKK